MMAPDLVADETMDLTGVGCPTNFTRAFLKLETMDEGELLEVIVDDGEPIANVPPELEAEGHTVVRKERVGPASWRLLVRRG